MTATRSPVVTADAIVSLHDEAMALPVILSGVLDAKIAECKAAMTKLEASVRIAATMADADAYAASVRTEANALLDKAKADADAVKKSAFQVADDVEAKRVDVNQQLTQLGNDRANLVARESALVDRASALAAAEAKNATESARLTTLAADIETKAQKLAKDRADVNARLDQLKLTAI